MWQVVGGLVLGLALGYSLQRGGFCMNSAFRSLVFDKDRSLIRAWIVVLVINVIGVNLLTEIGFLSPLVAPLFWPALLVGGFLFGIGMVLAGGCASGTYYRCGRGMLGSTGALIGFAVGTAALDGGGAWIAQRYLRAPTITIEGAEPTLFNLFGLSTPVGRWMLIGALVIAALWYLARAPEQRFVLGWGWRKTGLAVGVLALGAWVISSLTGRHFGLSFTQPTVSVTRFLISGDSSGVSIATWMLLGVPAGAFIAAKIRGEARWSLPEAKTLARQTSAGLAMGAGASIAGGCNIGHSITGIATLSVGSIVGTIAIMLGCWAMTARIYGGNARGTASANGKMQSAVSTVG
ncbi:MAG: YeeE/YedE family protein [Spirochaetaceae bacterium]|nr:MAG: YeeE/YedE family protein [Spirochaetaceae bacterium]